MESDLSLIGCASLNDQLQDDAREVIDFIRHKNKIKFWLVSGDKGQTLERMGKNLNVITPQTKVLRFDQTDQVIDGYHKKCNDFRKKNRRMHLLKYVFVLILGQKSMEK